MTINRIKIIAIAFSILPLLAVAAYRTPLVTGTVTAADTAETYKTKCAMCHTAKAEKFFDTAKTDDEHVNIIMKGKKGEKPPFMPGFEAKGMTVEEAKALATFMRGLRTPQN
jgi:mono/diheme cytochrome c family protein